MMASYEELFDSSNTLEQDEWAHDALAGIPACKGVLLFVDAQDHPIQILQTGNLRRLVRSRITPPEIPSPRKADVASLTRKIGWLPCHNDFMTQVHYIRLVHALFHKTANDWIQLSTPFMAAIDLNATLPYFHVTNDPTKSPKRIVYGMFPNRKAASKFTETLSSVFYLCQNPALLNNSKRSSCPYLQMAKCPGPCLDAAQKDSYMKRVHQATATEVRHIEPALHELRQQMHDAANKMDFEKANELKKQIDLLKKLQGSDYRWVHHLNDLSILHVDRSFRGSVEGKKRKVPHYKWLRIVSDAVYDLGDFPPQSHEDIERLLEQNWANAPKIAYACDVREHLGNVAYFLFRSKPVGFWLDCTEGIFADRLFPALDEFLQLQAPADSAEKKDVYKKPAS